jgi:hypothetical protein
MWASCRMRWMDGLCCMYMIGEDRDGDGDVLISSA